MPRDLKQCNSKRKTEGEQREETEKQLVLKNLKNFFFFHFVFFFPFSLTSPPSQPPP